MGAKFVSLFPIFLRDYFAIVKTLLWVGTGAERERPKYVISLKIYSICNRLRNGLKSLVFVISL